MWNVFRVIPSLYGWIWKTLRLSPLTVQHIVAVVTVGSQSRRSQIESYGSLRTPTLAVRIQLQLGLNTFLLFNSDSELCVESHEGKAESIVLLIFVIWLCFNCRWVTDSGVGLKVLFRASWNCIHFQVGF